MVESFVERKAHSVNINGNCAMNKMTIEMPCFRALCCKD